MAIDRALPEVGTRTHPYAQPGTYTVTIADESDASRKIVRTITVPFGLLVKATEDTADTDHRSVLVTVNNAGRGSVNLNWGDGTAVSPNLGDGVAVTRHKYANGGSFTITATDADDPTRKATTAVQVPFGPVPTVVEDTGVASRMAVTVTVDNKGNGQVSLNFGDGTAAVNNAGDGTAETDHTFANDGDYTLTVTDVSDPTSVVTRQISVPFSGGVALSASVAETVPNGPDRRSVTLTWDNQGQGPVTLDWGDSTTANGAVSGTADHVYAAGGTFNVVVTDASNTARTRTVPVTVPFTAVQPTAPVFTAVQGGTTRTVNVAVTVQAGRTYEVRWLAAGQFEDVPANGQISHVYTAGQDGLQTITVRDKVNTALTTDEQVTTPFP